MADYKVLASGMQREAIVQANIAMKLNGYAKRVRTVRTKLSMSSSTASAIKSKLKSQADAIDEERELTVKMAYGLDDIRDLYEETEKRIVGGDVSGDTDAGGNQQVLVELATSARDILDRFISGVIPDFSPVIDVSKLDISGALLSGSATAAGTILGLDASVTAEGELIGGSVTTKSKAKWDLDEGDFGMEAGIEAEGHLAQGEVSGSIGLLSGSLSGTVGAVSATGSVGVSLFKDGKLTPSLTAEAKAEAKGVSGEAEVSYGSETTNAHVKASGTIGNASAEASAKAGVITYEDDNGNTVTTYGVQGKVGAEAYVAEGSVSGGFTIFGITIDANVTGKAGGAGVSASGQVTAGGVSGSIGAGLGLGVGFSISIDWSNFSLW